MKSILYIMLLLCSFFIQAQSSSNEKAASNVSLSKKYAPKLLEAYQENAKTKVEDLFAYFQMLTDASLTDDYKKEIVKNIQYTFKNQNPEVIDFTSPTLDKILLNDFIQKLLISEPMIFKVSKATQNGTENYLSWKSGYTVTKTKSGISEDITVNQVVFLFEESKSFGSISKNVTVTFLGKMD
ncbi:hypothetical protein [Flavobacterium sp.]|uniref:hypothetical protein n=1 Tax=Flavobacterium sp. TaxID=239 RepID=UPI00391A5290